MTDADPAINARPFIDFFLADKSRSSNSRTTLFDDTGIRQFVSLVRSFASMPRSKVPLPILVYAAPTTWRRGIV